ncbi:cupin domain-containing protein [Bosea sp. (in: a-proteobacteria)]|uniref:cupin domain-containing protein n=1 Tax=Bosea sp. (in: a-proteobacteria) TaxID=1871050 RepID=UPI002FC7E443
MVTIRRHREPQPGQSRTIRFEGREAGGPVSLFLVDAAPGQGSSLHMHPYVETWLVRRGEAEFTVGDEAVRAFSGDIVVAPASVPHRFTHVGADRLELVCIHPSDTILQSSA